MILEEEKVVVVHPPRCGGSSLEYHFFGGHWSRQNLWMKHRSASEYVQLLSFSGLIPSEYHFYCLYRDPIERVRSMYRTGYWRCSYRLFGIEMGEFFFYFTLRPAGHEGNNLLLLDYGDFDVEWIQLHELCDRLGIADDFSSHEEKSDGSMKQLPYWVAECLLLPLFLPDILAFKRRVKIISIVLYPITYGLMTLIRLIQVCERLIKRFRALWKGILSARSIDQNGS